MYFLVAACPVDKAVQFCFQNNTHNANVHSHVQKFCNTNNTVTLSCSNCYLNEEPDILQMTVINVTQYDRKKLTLSGQVK